jgi:Rieske Fe-S protein
MTTTPQRTNEDEPDTNQPAAHLSTRRTVLASAGVVGAAAVLAACSSAGSGSSGSGSAGDGSTNSAPPSQASGDGAPSSAQAQGGSGTVLGPTSDVPVGGGKVYPAEKVVVTQPAAGTFKCFTAVCTHMGCTVNSVSGGTINCPCHGSQYHIADGSVAGGPAPSPLAAEKISVSGGQITLT